MIKLLTIIGARPQTVQASAISRAIKTHFAESVVEVDAYHELMKRKLAFPTLFGNGSAANMIIKEIIDYV